LPARRNEGQPAQAKPILEAAASALLRDRLIAEVHSLGSGNDAAIWAQKTMVNKNTLIAEDARVLEEAFQARLVLLGPTVMA
jgi:hypothetical protein